MRISRYNADVSAERQRLLRSALTYDGDQAWTHYRHLESQRNQFLGFFFTATIGSIGFLVALASSPSAREDVIWVGSAAIGFLLMLLSIAMYGAVRKIEPFPTPFGIEDHGLMSTACRSST